MADLYTQKEKTPISIHPRHTIQKLLILIHLIISRGTHSNDANAKCSRLFQTKLGVLSLFGLIYWLTISFTAYFTHNHSATWLFTYSVTSCVIALVLQFCVMAMVVYGLNENNNSFVGGATKR
eukprot:917433_1